jgi:hypothetical protein
MNITHEQQAEDHTELHHNTKHDLESNRHEEVTIDDENRDPVRNRDPRCRGFWLSELRGEGL